MNIPTCDHFNNVTDITLDDLVAQRLIFDFPCEVCKERFQGCRRDLFIACEESWKKSAMDEAYEKFKKGYCDVYPEKYLSKVLSQLVKDEIINSKQSFEIEDRFHRLMREKPRD